MTIADCLCTLLLLLGITTWQLGMSNNRRNIRRIVTVIISHDCLWGIHGFLYTSYFDEYNGLRFVEGYGQ